MKLKIERQDGAVIEAWGLPDELAPFVRLLTLPRTEDEALRARESLGERARVRAEQVIGTRPTLADDGAPDDTLEPSRLAPIGDLTRRPQRPEDT